MSVEKEINLSSVIEVMWERARGILMFTFAVLILSMLVSLTIRDRYTATAKVLMNKSKLGERTMVNPAIPFDTYLELAESESLYQAMQKKYKLNESPFSLRYPDDVKDRTEIITKDNTSMMLIDVQLEDAQIAADVANEIANILIEKGNEIIKMETTFSTGKIALEIEKIRENVEDRRKIYEDLLIKNKKQLVVNKLSSYDSILAKERAEIPNIQSAIQQYEGQISKFNEVLSATDFGMIIPIKKNVLDDLLFTEIIRNNLDQDRIESLSSISISEDQINTGYIQLRGEYEKLVVDLEGQRSLLDDKRQRTEKLEREVERLQDTVNKMELAEMIAKAEFDRELEILSGIEKQEGWAGTNVVTERQDLYLIEPAIAPMKKSYPQRTLLVGIVGTIAFLLSFMYYLLRDLYGLVKSEKAAN